MLKNYIKVALRNLLKNKGFSIINIVGLATGIACSILIYLFVSHELSYDAFHEKADRIYRLAVRASIGDTKIHQTYSSSLTFKHLLEDFPEIDTGVKFLKMGRTPVKIGEKTFFEERLYAVDETFFNVFSIPLIHGDPQSVLVAPNKMIVSRDTALKYFGTTDVVGRILTVESSRKEDNIDAEITGVSENVPANSHFHYDLLLSSATFPDNINDPGWTSNNFISYVVLKEGTSAEQMDEKLKDFTREHMGGEQFDAWVAKGNFWEYFMQPITKIHLTSDLNGEFEANGNETYVFIFSLVSIIILLIACINFMNLSTAKSSLRAKEVALRKVVGSNKSRLVFQFLGESVFLSYISMAVGILAVISLLPFYKKLIGKPIGFHFFDNPLALPLLLGLGLVVGVISGSYPAFFLSSFKPIAVLKAQSETRRGGGWLRNMLVVFQFGVSVFLIIGTLVVSQQLKYFQNKKLGFNKEQVLVIQNPGSLGERIIPFKESLLKSSRITNVSGSNSLPGRSFSNFGFGAEGVDEQFTLNICVCDHNFAQTLELEMSQGRFFSRDFASDSHAVILNEKAAELLGWRDPLGKRINNWDANRGDFTVIGVTKDYHYESLHQEIRPMALFLSGGYYTNTERYISLRLQTENISDSIRDIKNNWDDFARNTPFEYSFLDQDFDNLYLNEKQTRKMFSIFSFLAIFIACLGLFGLASYTADRRTKEIGIRKVMGASAVNIVSHLNKGFTRWVFIANVIAWPTAWFVMNRWLQNFAYRIGLSWWMFALAAALSMLIALLTVSLQTVKAALKNPIESMRYE